MAEKKYIEREAVLKIIEDNCPHDTGGYNTEEEMGAGAACFYIRRDVDNLPTADVAPRAEVERWRKNLEAVLEERAADKAEVAAEIFTEIKEQLRGIFDFFRQDNDIRESCAIMFAISEVNKIEKKYTGATDTNVGHKNE